MATLPIANKKDIQIGAVSGTIALLLVVLLLLFMTYEEADPKPEPLRIEATAIMDEIDLKDMKMDIGGGSEGAPSNDPVKEPEPETEQVITKKDNPKTSTSTGQSTKTTKPNSKGDPSSAKASDNPFGGNGSGEKGPGSGKFGNDDSGGSGGGPGGGIGDGSGRKRLTSPNIDDIASDENHTIFLRIIINAEGQILQCSNLNSRTTTTDQRIINKVIAAVKSDVTFSKKPGSGQEQLTITVNINAN